VRGEKVGGGDGDGAVVALDMFGGQQRHRVIVGLVERRCRLCVLVVAQVVGP